RRTMSPKRSSVYLMTGPSIVGSFVGTFTDLVEITNLTERGELISEVLTYPLSDANRALRDLAQGKVTGRAVLIPE
ncbi:MAG: zinc-binding dehydrogenase, partial [bacterium]